MRWILLDQVIRIEKGIRAVTAAHLAQESEFSLECLLIEMMAQTSGLLLGAETNFQQDLVFTKIESADFFLAPGPRDILKIEATSEHLKSEGAWMDAAIHLRHQRVAQSRLLLMNVGLLLPETQRSVTFHEGFLSHYQVLEKIR